MITQEIFPRFYQPLLGELTEAFERFVNTGYFIGGPLVQEFEQAVCSFLGSKHAVGCKSGTHALSMALRVAGVGEGDEVVTVANTYYATARAIRDVGAIPVFCDIHRENPQLDPECLKNVITDRTRAIIPVHLYGAPAPLVEINAIADAHKLAVIEDCAHAFGSRFKDNYIGADSPLACFSFYPTKSLGAFGDAGMIVTNSKQLADELLKKRYFTDNSRADFDPMSFHARLDALQASLLIVLLNNFEDIAIRRKKLASIYHQILSPHLDCLPYSVADGLVPYLFCFYVENRDELLTYLKEKKIHLNIRYSVDLHRLQEFGSAESGTLPNTEWHNSHVVSLSLHPSLTEEDVSLTAKNILSFLGH